MPTKIGSQILVYFNVEAKGKTINSAASHETPMPKKVVVLE
jgi:hypothetical protein